MTAPAFAMLAFVALHAAMGSLKISDAARAYARRSLADEAAIANLENLLRVDAGVSWPTLQLELGYEPRLMFVDVLGSGPSTTLWLQSAAAHLSLHQPRYTLSIAQTGTVGEQDFTQVGTTAAPQPSEQPASPTTGTANQSSTQTTGSMAAPALNPLPNARAVRVANEETTSNLTFRWTRRWRSDLNASFGFSGGADAAAQRFLPRQRRAQLDASLGYESSRRDRISTVLMGAQIETSNGYEHWLASVSETWAARWTSATGSQLGLGVAIQDTTAPDGTRLARWSPIGSANLTHAFLLREVKVRLQAGLGYAPDVNVLVGRLQNRLQASSLASIATAHLTVSLILGAAQTIPANAPDAATLTSAALNFEYELLDWLNAQVGGQVAQQDLGRAIASSRATWLLYAGLLARAPEHRF